MTTITPTQSTITSGLTSFLYGITMASLFGLSVVFSHYDTKGQIKDQSIVIEESTKVYVQTQQDVLYNRVQREVNQSLDGIRTELAQTNTLLRQITDYQISNSASYGNTSTSTSSVVNTPSTTVQTSRGDP